MSADATEVLDLVQAADGHEEPVIELRDVRAAYGRIEVLHGVDLVVPRGSVVALLGPNGGGKTTTLKVISGQVPATAGCVHIAGRHVNGASSDALARTGVCTIPEGRGIFPNLTRAREPGDGVVHRSPCSRDGSSRSASPPTSRTSSRTPTSAPTSR